MLSPNDHDYYKIFYCTILYIQSHNCISNIFCRSFLYESCVSIKFISSSSSSSRRQLCLHSSLHTIEEIFPLWCIIYDTVKIHSQLQYVPMKLYCTFCMQHTLFYLEREGVERFVTLVH